MPTIEEIAHPQARTLTQVPAAGPGVCRVCHGCPNPGFATCYSCQQVMHQVSRPCRSVLPFSLYRTPGQLWSVLRYYKDSTSDEVRARFATQVAAFLGVLLVRHGDCIRAELGGWDALATVPSSSGRRTGPHPLAAALRRVAAIKDEVEDLLAPGPAKLGFNRADDEGFVVTREVEGRSVVVVDDTYTTGARSQSAASALQLAGATVPAIVVVGRVIDPTWSEATGEMWARQKGVAFDFNRCALEEDPTGGFALERF